MKTNDSDVSYDSVSPLAQVGETLEERALIATLKVLVAMDEVSENEVNRAWKFVVNN